jgi:hypothetical protein
MRSWRNTGIVRSAGSTSVPGQTEKNSVRANVFRYALELGHCPMKSALRICAISGLLQIMLRRTRLSSQVDTRFGRVAGGAFPLLACQDSNRRHRERHGIMFHAGSRANEAGVYSVSLSQPRPRFGWFALQPTRRRSPPPRNRIRPPNRRRVSLRSLSIRRFIRLPVPRQNRRRRRFTSRSTRA